MQFIEPFLLASSIIGVLGVRLVRKNCTYCSQPYEPEPGYLRLIPQEMLETAELRRGVGCKHCIETGFGGRTAITELLVANEAFREAVLQKLPTRTLQKVATDQGMRSLWEMGLQRVVRGETPLEEILRVVSYEQV